MWVSTPPPPPRRHPCAVSLLMFFSQFPTVLRHKQAYSAGLARFRKRRGKKVVEEYSFWMLSRSFKCHVSAPETPTPLVIHAEKYHPHTSTKCVCVCEVRDYNKAGYHSDHTFITSRMSSLLLLGNEGEACRSWVLLLLVVVFHKHFKCVLRQQGYITHHEGEPARQITAVAQVPATVIFSASLYPFSILI